MKPYKWPLVHELLFVLSYLGTNSATFFVLGLINRFVLRGRLTTVYCTYPVNRRYLVGITRPLYAPLLKWHPCIVGLFLLKDGGGITVVTTATEREMEDRNNRAKLAAVERKLERWTRLMGGTQHTHGGRMPSILTRAGISSSTVESHTVASLCTLAVEKLCADHGLSDDMAAPSAPTPCPVAIIGSQGYVGRNAASNLRARGHTVLEIDRVEQESNLTDQILNPYRGSPFVVLNLSRKGVLAEYADKFWPGVYVLDDVYPECSAETLETLRLCGAKYYHISGIKASSFPKLIGAYEGVIPFCAVAARHFDDNALSRVKSEIVVRGR
jgi:hypothetical protein